MKLFGRPLQADVDGRVGDEMLSGKAAGLRRHKYAALLALLLVSLAIQSLNASAGVERTLSDLFRTVLGIAILVVVFQRPRERLWMATILVGAIAIGWWHDHAAAGLDRGLSLALHALTALFLWVA